MTSPDPAPTTRASARSSAPRRRFRWLRVLIPALLILGWTAGAGIGGPYFGKVEEVSSNDQSAYLPSSAEATAVQDLLPEFLGGESIPALIVVTGDGELTDTQLADLTAFAATLVDVDGVEGDVSPPIPSEDGEAAQVFAPLNADHVKDAISNLRAALDADLPDGLTAWITGPAGFTADLAAGFAGIDGLLLAAALGAVFIILVIVYRSPLLPILVLSTSVFALCVALLTVWWLAKAEIVVLNGQVQGILFILVIGAATDYALLYVARFKEALADGEDRWQATRSALKGAFEPIIASGGTVIAGLLCLLLSDLATNRALGPIASIGIVFAMLSALTFLPAMLAAVGRAAFWPFMPKPLSAAEKASDPLQRKGLWPANGRLVAKRARPIWIISTLILVVAAFGVTQLKADGVPTSDLVLGYSEAREGQDVLTKHFPGGSGSPAYIVVPEAEAADVVELVQADAGVDSIAISTADSPTGQAGVELEGGELVLTAVGPPGTPAPAATVHDGQVMLVLTLADAADSFEAEETIIDLRTALNDVSPDALVGGTTAVDVDTNQTSIRDRTVIIPIVLVVILVILMLLLRAVVAPVLLILSVILSFGSALGVSALVFNGIFDFPGADPAVPLYGFVFLVALGVDYNIFLMSRVREESIAFGTRKGILRGLVETGGVITSAGLVLAATFAALSVIPILFLVQLAFIVAFGVLLDTFLVRSFLVPALSYDLGRRIWWPSKLSRRDVDEAAAARAEAAAAAPQELRRRSRA